MTLEILQTEMVKALKEHNKMRKETLATLVGAVKNAGIAKKCRDNIPETLVDETLIKEQKVVQEQIDNCPVSREDLLAEYNFKLSVIKEFAPQLVTDPEEIKRMIEIHIVENIPGQEFIKSNRGVLMKTLSPVMKGKVDMRIMSQVLESMLV